MICKGFLIFEIVKTLSPNPPQKNPLKKIPPTFFLAHSPEFVPPTPKKWLSPLTLSAIGGGRGGQIDPHFFLAFITAKRRGQRG